MGNNQLSGAIPTSIQRLQNLQGLYLNDNELGGHIPYELYQLYNLAELILKLTNWALTIDFLEILLQYPSRK